MTPGAPAFEVTVPWGTSLGANPLPLHPMDEAELTTLMLILSRDGLKFDVRPLGG